MLIVRKADSICSNLLDEIKICPDFSFTYCTVMQPDILMFGDALQPDMISIEIQSSLRTDANFTEAKTQLHLICDDAVHP